MSTLTTLTKEYNLALANYVACYEHLLDCIKHRRTIAGGKVYDPVTPELRKRAANIQKDYETSCRKLSTYLTNKITKNIDEPLPVGFQVNVAVGHVRPNGWDKDLIKLSNS